MKIVLYLYFFVSLFAQTPVFEGVSAVVGNNIILKSDISQLVSMTALQQKIDLRKNPDYYSKIEREVLENLINQRVILEMAKLDSVEVKEKDVEDALNQQIENIILQAGSRDLAEDYLGQSIKSFRREFWSDMRDRLISEQYQFSLLNKVTINRDETQAFFDEYKDSLGVLPSLYRINHIQLSVKPSEKNLSKTLKRVNEIRSRILSGDSFDSLAIIFSDDPGSASRGGSLGYVERGSLVTEFESVAFSQEINTVSEPVLTQFGFHLIETLDKQGEKAKVRHILIKPEITEADDSRTFSFTKTLMDSISSYKDFKIFAGKYSEDNKTKDIGGSLGWVNPAELPIVEFMDAIKLMDSINICSFPIKSSLGYHLLWISDFRPGGKPNLSDHWPEIENFALNNKKGNWFQNWLNQSRSILFIDIYDQE